MGLSDIKQRLDKVYTGMTVRYARQFFSHNDINQNPYVQASLTGKEKSEIRSFWKPYARIGKDSWQWFQFYKEITDCPDLLKYYIPEGIYYSRIDSKLSNVKDCEAVDDKNLYDLLFYDVAQPLTICRIQRGLLLDEKYEPINIEAAEELIKLEGQVIIKPSRDSCSGAGIKFYDTSKDNLPLKKLSDDGESIVIQKVLTQHEALAALHPQSLNTIRLLTLLENNEVVVLSGVLRIGTGQARVDNAHSGGIVCGINEDGRLKSKGFNLFGKRYEVNPTTGLPFNLTVVPSYDQCKELVCKLAPRLAEFTKLASWDLSVNEEGEPILIEVNMTYGGVDVHQLCNGPVFGQRTERILKELM